MNAFGLSIVHTALYKLHGCGTQVLRDNICIKTKRNVLVMFCFDSLCVVSAIMVRMRFKYGWSVCTFNNSWHL